MTICSGMVLPTQIDIIIIGHTVLIVYNHPSHVDSKNHLLLLALLEAVTGIHLLGDLRIGIPQVRGSQRCKQKILQYNKPFTESLQTPLQV